MIVDDITLGRAIQCVILFTTKMNKLEFANRVDSNEAAHYEPSHLDLFCLPSL